MGKKGAEENESKLKELEKKIQSFENLEKEKTLIETKMKKEESVQRGLREIIAKHEATIGKKEDDASALQKRNTEVIGDKNKKIAELNSEIAKLKESQTEWESKLKNVTEGQKGTQQVMAKKDEEIHKLNRLLQNSKQAETEKMQKHQQAMKTKDEEILKLKNTNDNLTTQYQSEAKKVKELSSNSAEINTVRETYKTQIKYLQVKQDEIENNLKKAKDDKNNLEGQLKSLKEEKSNLTSESEK